MCECVCGCVGVCERERERERKRECVREGEREREGPAGYEVLVCPKALSGVILEVRFGRSCGGELAKPWHAALLREAAPAPL